MVEVRNPAPLVLKNLDTLLKEIVVGQQNLPPIVAWVGILLHDRQHGVDGDPVSATAQGFGNITAQTEAELLRAGSAQIGRWIRFLGGLRFLRRRLRLHGAVPSQAACYSFG